MIIRLAMLAACASGCSLVLMDRAPTKAIAGDSIRCSSGRGAPIADAAVATAAVIAGVATAIALERQAAAADNNGLGSGQLEQALGVGAGVVGVVYGAAFAAASAHGFATAAHCRDVGGDADTAVAVGAAP